MFNYIENVFPQDVIDSLHNKYITVKEDDLTSYDIWPPLMTEQNTLPANYTQHISKKDKLLVLSLLFDNEDSPFYNDARLRYTNIAIQKISPGSRIPRHTDTALGSLTVFLNKEYDTSNGGEFLWWENEESKVSYSVIPKYNCGVWALYNEGDAMPHEVTTVNNYHRVSIQFFIWGKDQDPTVKYAPRDENAVH
jgi:hypothetical protein